MSTRRALDALLERGLVERGLISDRALAHARAVQQRGLSDTPIGEILVDLELISSELLVSALAEISGARLWDGEGLDVDLARAVRVPRAVALRREGGTVWYATGQPHDEGLREDVRFAAGTQRAEPLVASEELLALALRRAGSSEPDGSDGANEAWGLEPLARTEWDALELELCARWRAEDADTNRLPAVVLTNRLLLDHPFRVPGGVLRVEATDRPMVRTGRGGQFDDSDLLSTSASTLGLQMVIWRLKHMAALPPGHGSFGGWIRIHAARDSCRSFELNVEPTDRGDVALVQRSPPWNGVDLPSSHEWSAHRSAIDEIWRALADGRLDRLEYARRSALQTAERIGAPATIEIVSALIHLAAFLDGQRRENEARPLLERASELAHEHGLGGRVIGDIESIAACVEVDDLSARVARFERTEEIYRAPGPGRRVTTAFALEIAYTERFRERHEAALRAAERAIDEDRRWFGATTVSGLTGICEASLACAALGRAEEAEEHARAALKVAGPIGCVDQVLHWVLGRAALVGGRTDESVAELRRAQSFFSEELASDPDWIAIAVDLARALESLGRLNEAREVLSKARALPSNPATAAARRDLEALLRRSGPYR